ncbi:MAG: peptide deformylase [Candidatus Colwellbacteria bacterium]|nr:peptide deformylase [Candidatus Colwellbacteria bacterium]
MTKILSVKNKHEEDVLRRKTYDFDFGKFKKSEVSELIKKMRITMDEADGIGLSANQIGLSFSVFVAKADKKFYAIFNPKITKESSSEVGGEEGCLSVPQVYGEVFRPDKITLTGLDKNGKKIKIKAWGLLSRVFQHEVDHLNGKLFTDRIKK